MNRIRISLALCAALTAAAQSPNDVTFNVIVKDKKGVTVKGLTASQFEVTDGGAKAKSVAVRLIDGAASPDPVRLITLAFEGMGNAERRLAKDTALNLLKEDKDPNHLFAVFMFVNQLCLLQPFTADRAALAAAVETANSGVLNTRFVEMHEQSKRKLAAEPATPLTRTQLKMIEFDGKLANEEQNRRTILFLNSLASGLAGFPGRKAIAYVTWGMVVPTHLQASFEGLQARANRAGVSFYGVDSRGVSEGRQNANADDAVGKAGGTAAEGLGNAASVNHSGFDNLQDSMRSNPQAGLRVLAESTGGFLIGDTNDPRPLLRQMIDDTNTYYEVTYDPAIAKLDGSYRKTSVKVNAKDARVRDRDGYLALAADQIDLLPYEIPLLEALKAAPLLRELEFRSGAVRLRQSKDEVAASVIVEVPLAGLLFKEDKTAGIYAGRLAMLVQVKDADGKVVRKYSRDLPLQGKIEQLAALKNSNFNFREQFTAPPGRYVVETAVMDLGAGKTGARRAAFAASGKAAGIALSGITVVRNFQPNQPNLAPDEPFQFQGGRITPTLTATLKSVKGAQMALFFTVYPDKAAAADAKPEAVIQYLKEGTELAKAALPLPAADATGKITYVFSSPIDTMPPGVYEIKVQVKQGASAAEESVLITIEG